MQEKCGFVYLWLDKKHKRYYVGCHWGHVKDGYVCSSDWMTKAYKRRPQDFKRRILATITTNRAELLEEEYRWLQMIKPEEIKVRYYNLNTHHHGHWSTDDAKRERIGKEHSSKMKGRKAPWNSKPCPEEKKVALSKMWTDVPKGFRGTDATRAKISANSKRLQAEGRVGMRDKKHSEDTKKKMSKNNAMLNPIHKDKVKQSKQGIKHLVLEDNRKMAVPGTEYFNQLMSQGYSIVEKRR